MATTIKSMLEDIEFEAKITAASTGRRQFDQRVMSAMADVNRDEFVGKNQRDYAYNNRPLPIGYGQTISQPYIVALMTDLLDLTGDSVVLEVGTGSGYQAAILSKQIYTVERIPELFELATSRLQELGYSNVETRCANGYSGWKEKAPFDAITVTAAATSIPSALIDQLKPGGRMVIPVGLPRMHQELMLVSREQNGEINTRSVLDVAFVPLINKEA